MAKIKISELPELDIATLDTTYVAGVYNGVTYKIPISKLTSSLDTTFATDLITTALSSSLNSKLSTSSYSTDSASFNSRIISGSAVTGTISSSAQISDLGFVTGSYTTLNSFNNLTQSFNSISQSFTTISGSFGDIDFSGINAVTESYLLFTQSYYSASASFDERIIAATNEQDLSYLATTGSNTFIGNQIISGSATISQGIHNWEFGSDGIIKLNNGYGEIYADADSGSVRIGTAAENVAPNAQIILGGPDNVFKIKSGPPLREWTFEGNGDFNLSGSINGASNLVTTSSFNTFTQSYYSASASFDSRVDSLKNATSSYLTSLNGAISSSTQVLNGSGIYSSSTQLPTNIISSSTQISSLGFISTSVSLTSLNTISASYLTFTQSYYSDSASFSTRIINAQPIGYLTTSSYQTDSASFNSRIISGIAVAGTISSSAQISALGYITSSQTVNTSSLVTTSSFNSFTSSVTTMSTSVDSRLDIVEATASLYTPFSSSVDNRLDVLEGTIISGSANYIQVLIDPRRGVTTTGAVIISGSITTTGNPVQIMVTGDANPVGGTAWTRLQIFRDSNAIGGIVQVENTSNLNVPYCLNVIDTPSAGTYTYSMRTVSGIAGTFDFGEHNGPTLTAVELRTNTNLPSTNNTFTGNNTFRGTTRFETVGGNEGGEIEFGVPETNTTLTSSVKADVYQNTFRIFDGNTKGVYIDLSKAPTGANGEITWKTSGYVNAGTFLTLDNLKVSCTTGGNRGLSIGAVSTNFTANVAGWFGYSGGGGGASANNVSYTTTAAASAFGWMFGTEGDTSNYTINDKTNNRVYRVTLMIGAGYNNNFISIERLH